MIICSLWQHGTVDFERTGKEVFCMTSSQKQGFLCIAFTTMMFSLMEIALKFISGDLNPVQITFSRFLFGGVVL